MCGRFTIGVLIEDIADYFNVPPPSFDHRPRYNVAPSQRVPILRTDAEGARKLVMAHWGLVPSWADDRKIGNRMINARAESVATKPAFRSAFRHRRCLVPADGFYEWQNAGGVKTPFWIGMKEHGLFAFAGLWETWTDRGAGEHIESCTIITTDSNELLRSIHDRMPVILSSSHYETWIDPGTPADDLLKLLRPCDPRAMTCHEVSRAVNSPTRDSPDLLSPVTPLP